MLAPETVHLAIFEIQSPHMSATLAQLLHEIFRVSMRHYANFI